MTPDHSLCFLTFTRNDTEGAAENVKTFYGKVDEIVIIDSSTSQSYSELVDRTKEYGAKIYHVLPMGFTPPLMRYALKKVESEIVIQLDSSEKISEALLNSLNKLGSFDAYAIHRIEIPYNYYTWQIRIFYKSKTEYQGYHHEKISVRGNLLKLKEKDFYIYGMTDLTNMRKMRNYMALDIIERPLTYEFLFSRIHVLNKNVRHKFAERPISKAFLSLYKLILYYNMIKYGSNAQELSYFFEYLNLYHQVYRHLNSDVMSFLNKLTRAIDEEGGPIKYLCLDDIVYVDSLSKKEVYSAEGISIFLYLLNFRFENGVCAPEINYCDLELNPLYKSLNEAIEKAKSDLELRNES